MRIGRTRMSKVSSSVSWPIAVVLVLVSIFSGSLFFPAATASNLTLTAGNVDFTISDYGVISNGISWNFGTQTSMVYNSYINIHHNSYPSGGGGTDVANGYGVGTGDFTVDEQNVFVQTGSIQETYSSFTQTGVNGVSNDLKIYQRAIAKDGENWAIVVWKLQNIYGQDINNLRVGMNFHTRIGGTPGDDVDGWNSVDSIYYVKDQPTGNVFMGLGSADPSLPLNRYYGSPAGVGGAVDPSDDQSLLNSLTTTKVHGSPEIITCMVGWEVGTLPAGSNISLPLVIAFGSRYEDIDWAIGSASQFLVFQMTKLAITEVQDYNTIDNVKIEVYNHGERAVSDSEIYLSPDVFTQWTSGIWSASPVVPGSYTVYSLGPGESFASTEGGKVSLHFSGGFLLDSVSFGQEGPAPDPIQDESVARQWSGGRYSDVWVRDPTPTFGTQNDVSGKLNPPVVVLNEVYFNANLPNDRFIELYFPGPGSVSVNGWLIVSDFQYTLPFVTLDATRKHFVLRGDDFPVNFGMDDGTTNGDNVYLYDNAGRLVDMVGWSSGHSPGQSVSRLTNPLQWGYEGYDDSSSVLAGWRFDRTPTPETLSIEPDQSKMVDVGLTAEYDVVLSYLGSSSDYLDITFTSSLGWTTAITDAFGNPIIDHDGDMVPDGDMMLPGNFLDLKVWVTAPLDPKSGNFNYVYVTATSSVNTDVYDIVRLITTAVVPPYITLNKTADPDTIWVEDSQVLPQETTVTLNVTGAGTPLVWYTPQDAVFVIDNSGSMQWNDPSGLRFTGARDYVDMMKVPDRAATVQFTSSAFLVNNNHLSWNYPQVKADISSIPPPGGGTNIRAGLSIANDELIAYGDSTHLFVEILLTDGRNSNAANDGPTLQEAQRAADNGIVIFTIGLLVGGDVNEQLLQQIADITGGEYHPAPTPEALQDIYLGIFERVMNIAGKRIDDPVNPNPMMRDVLPPYIHYVPGSFRDEASNPLPPHKITVDQDGNTLLDWDVDVIYINQSWIAKYEVTSSLEGYVPVGVYPFSRVNFTKWDNSTENLPFPEVFINVLFPEPINPPILGIEADQNDVHLSWTIPGPNITHYLIYRSEHQTDFDFTTLIHDTSSDVNPTRTDWTDPGAASLNPREYYYIVRAVNNLGLKSITSNTVGKFTRNFDAGLNAFSLPLDTLVGNDIEWYASSIPNTVYIDWMDNTDHWVRHWKGGPVTKPGPLSIGEGYQISLSAQTTFTFVGTPASMIRYHESLGQSLNFREGLTILAGLDDVNLFWRTATGAAGYNIYRVDNRMAFHQGTLTPLITLGPGNNSWTDNGAISLASEWYYTVVPLTPGGREGSSAYSVGIISVSYKEGHNAMGLPLKPSGWWTLDHYCENIQTATGMAYMTMGVWKFHATEMPAGVYDPFIEQGEGYQLSLDGLPSRYIYIGL